MQRSAAIKFNRKRLYVAEYGTLTGVPVFAFHGTPATHRQFQSFDKAAKTLGIRLIVPDRPGYGSSDRLEPASFEEWTHFVAAIAEELNVTRFGIIGYASGGIFALACAHNFPDRLLGVAIVNCFSPGNSLDDLKGMDAGELAILKLSHSWPLGANLLLGLSRRLIVLLGRERLTRLSSSLPDPDKKMFESLEFRQRLVDEASANENAARAAVTEFRAITSEWGFDLSELDVKIDIFQGLEDRATPAWHSERLTRMIPKSIHHKYAEHGHISILNEGSRILECASGV